MQVAEEQQLVYQARRGNRDAFRCLVDRYMKHAYDLAYGFVNDHDDAEDVAQESFLRAWQGLVRFRGEAGFGTWLYRIVTNVALNRVKQKNSAARRRLPHDGTGDIPHDPPWPDLSRIDVRTHVERALHELPTLQRAVVILRHINGLSTKQVSGILGCSEGTVKTHLHRGLVKLRKLLGHLEEDRL